MTNKQLKESTIYDDDFDNYRLKSPEERCWIVAKHFWHYWLANDTDRMRFMEGRLIEITGDMDEHPAFMEDMPCLCRMCCSCG